MNQLEQLAQIHKSPYWQVCNLIMTAIENAMWLRANMPTLARHLPIPNELR